MKELEIKAREFDRKYYLGEHDDWDLRLGAAGNGFIKGVMWAIEQLRSEEADKKYKQNRIMDPTEWAEFLDRESEEK